MKEWSEMARFACLILLGLLVMCGGSGVAKGQAGAAQNAAPKFTSAYTDLNTQCRDAVKEVGEGQDTPLRCKGYGGYSIYIYYSAANSWLAAETRDRQTSIPLTGAHLNFDREKGRKVEWRMANGKPFAVILRVEGKLQIRGLKGYEQLIEEVDPKTNPNANERAREIVDKAYLAGRGN
jgi:hypothetical protein